MTIEKTIEDMLPKSLDDIIRKNRDRCSIRLSGNQELMTLAPMVSKMNEPKDVRAVIDDWRVICLTLDEKRHLFLTGVHRERDIVWMTSDVAAVDLLNNLVLTRNSLYQLGKRGDDAPRINILLHICATLQQWGFRGFGIPAIFY